MQKIGATGKASTNPPGDAANSLLRNPYVREYVLSTLEITFVSGQLWSWSMVRQSSSNATGIVALLASIIAPTDIPPEVLISCILLRSVLDSLISTCYQICHIETWAAS